MRCGTLAWWTSGLWLLVGVVSDFPAAFMVFYDAFVIISYTVLLLPLLSSSLLLCTACTSLIIDEYNKYYRHN